MKTKYRAKDFFQMFNFARRAPADNVYFAIKGADGQEELYEAEKLERRCITQVNVNDVGVYINLKKVKI